MITPQPPPGDPLWLKLGKSPSDGQLYNTTCENNPVVAAGVPGTMVELASQSPPGYGGQQGPPAQIAAFNLIVATNLILPPEVHTAPFDTARRPASVGLVGLPVWMWQNPQIVATWGPINPTVLVGPLNLLGIPIPALGVTVNALGQRIDWYMGDGTDVVCNGLSAPYPAPPPPPPPGSPPPPPPPSPPPTGPISSPDCGYQYSQPSTNQPGGVYTVTAAATWNVTWHAGITSGSLTIIRYTTLQLKISELQVVNQ
jgi:hypothetical protein